MVAERNTKQQALVIEAIHVLDNHPTAEQIYLYVKQKNSRISRSTAYRNLNKLVSGGVIQQVKTRGSEHFEVRIDRHYHFECSVCGSIYDVKLPYDVKIDQLVSGALGGEVHFHRMIFEGICSKCKK